MTTFCSPVSRHTCAVCISKHLQAQTSSCISLVGNSEIIFGMKPRRWRSFGVGRRMRICRKPRGRRSRGVERTPICRKTPTRLSADPGLADASAAAPSQLPAGPGLPGSSAEPRRRRPLGFLQIQEASGGTVSAGSQEGGAAKASGGGPGSAESGSYSRLLRCAARSACCRSGSTSRRLRCAALSASCRSGPRDASAEPSSRLPEDLGPPDASAAQASRLPPMHSSE